MTESASYVSLEHTSLIPTVITRLVEMPTGVKRTPLTLGEEL
jgi:hypothetical protein